MGTLELVDAAEQSLQTAVKSFLTELQSDSQMRKVERGHGREEHLRRLANRLYWLAADNQLRECTGQGFSRLVLQRKLRPLGPGNMRHRHVSTGM